MLAACGALTPPLHAQRFSAVEAGAGAAVVVARHSLMALEVGAG